MRKQIIYRSPRNIYFDQLTNNRIKDYSKNVINLLLIILYFFIIKFLSTLFCY